jgi:hypothetical protein
VSSKTVVLPPGKNMGSENATICVQCVLNTGSRHILCLIWRYTRVNRVRAQCVFPVVLSHARQRNQPCSRVWVSCRLALVPPQTYPDCRVSYTLVALSVLYHSLREAGSRVAGCVVRAVAAPALLWHRVTRTGHQRHARCIIRRGAQRSARGIERERNSDQ